MPLAVCVGDLCREVVIVVLPINATTTTTTITSTTVVPQPAGDCAVLSGSLIVEPSGGEPGTALVVSLIGTADSPPACQAVLQLAGEPISAPFELAANAETRVEASVPAGIATGETALDVVDLATAEVLASATFDVGGGAVPWALLGVAAFALLGLVVAIVRWINGRNHDSGLPDPVEPAEVIPTIAPRWLEARIFAREDGLEVPVEYFRPNTTHRIEVRLGAAQPSDIAAVGHQTQVILTEPALLAKPQSADVVLAATSPSTPASFMLTTWPDTASVNARLILMNGTRVAQTALLPSAVGPAPETPVTDVARIETVVRAPVLPAEHNGVAAAIVVEGGGAPTITQVGSSHQKALVKLSESGVEAMDQIRSHLGQIVEAPEEFAGLESEGTRSLLVFLAHHGRLLRSAIVDDFLGEELAASNSLQVVSATPDAYLPFELAYNFTAPRLDAEVCREAGDALRSTDPAIVCRGVHDESVVCPMGFWGMSKVIERHAFQPAEDLPAGFLVRAQPVGQRNRIPLASGVLVGASDRVDAHHPGTLDHVIQRAAATAGKAWKAQSWVIWDGDAATRRPSVLALLPHTIHSDQLGSFGLEIGATDKRWAAQIDSRMVPDSPVVAVLLGCETAVAGAVSYERFPGLLRRAGAEIVDRDHHRGVGPACGPPCRTPRPRLSTSTSPVSRVGSARSSFNCGASSWPKGSLWC